MIRSYLALGLLVLVPMVRAQPTSVTVTPQANAISVGETQTLMGTVGGTGPFSYQWNRNGTPIGGATNSTLQVTGDGAYANDADYTLTASNGTSLTSSAAHIYVKRPAPVISVQPQSQSATRGTQVTFSVAQSTYAPTEMEYMWFRGESPNPINPTPLSTTSTLNVTASVNGTQSFFVRVGGVVSAPPNPVIYSEYAYSQTVQLTTGSAQLPVITQQPVATIAPAGSPVTLSVTATGDSLTYSWFKGGISLSDPSMPSGLQAMASNRILSFVADPSYYGNYFVQVHGSSGTVTSETVTLSVTPDVIITSQPSDRLAAPGESVNFTVVATRAPGVISTSPLVYQWRKADADIPGATSATLSLAQVGPADAAHYSVSVTGDYGPVTSVSAELTVSATSLSAPGINLQPGSVTIAAGGTASFGVIASGLGPLSYQWSHNSVPISGATSSILMLIDVQASDAGNYSVVVSNSRGSVESNLASLTVSPGSGNGGSAASAPVFQQQPHGLGILGGHDARFTVVATGNPDPTYQWYFNGQPINGATAATYVVANVQVANAGSYYVVISNSAGSSTSAPVTLSVTQSSFQGVYAGKLGADGLGGDFALYIRSDGTGVMLTHFASSDTAVLLDSITVGENSSFLVSGTTLAHDGWQSAKDADGPATTSPVTAGDTATVSGMISPSGGLSGSIRGLTFAAQRSAGSNAFAGFYKAPAVNGGDGTAYAIVDGDGHALVLAQTGTRATVGTGSVDNSGQLNVSVADGGLFAAKLDPANGGLSATVDKGAFSGLAFTGIRDNVTHTDRLANISTRGRTGIGDQVLIAGFIISGETPRQVLVRAIGPTLTDFGVTGTLGNPRFEIYRGNTKIAESNDWGSESDADQVAAKSPTVGAFALPRTGKDAALLVTLDPGAYTAVVSGVADTTGVTLVEVYDAGDMQAGTPKLYNISSRGYVGTDDQILIAGIIVGGNAPKRLLVRAVGPTLGTQGIANALSDPVLTIYKGSTVISQNDDWGGDSAHAALSKSLGAFDLPANSKDASLLITLAPGVYTAQVTGKEGAQGIALVEVYDAGD